MLPLLLLLLVSVLLLLLLVPWVGRADERKRACMCARVCVCACVRLYYVCTTHSRSLVGEVAHGRSPGGANARREGEAEALATVRAEERRYKRHQQRTGERVCACVCVMSARGCVVAPACQSGGDRGRLW